MAQWLANPTKIMGTQEQSLASLSGLKILSGCELWYRLQTRLKFGVAVAVAQAGSCSSDSTPSLGTSTCYTCCPKKKKIKLNK